MNQRIQKAIDDIERTKAKIAELQALLPELERKKKDLEDAEILRLVRSANVKPGEIAAFIESIKQGRQPSRTNEGQNLRPNDSGASLSPAIKQEEATENGEA